jgi:hypothetical protein
VLKKPPYSPKLISRIVFRHAGLGCHRRVHGIQECFSVAGYYSPRWIAAQRAVDQPL